MSDYRRYRVPGGTYFLTVNLLERRSDLLVRQIDVLREAVRRTRRERPFAIDAWVVLPDHMHCVITLPEGDDEFSNRISPRSPRRAERDSGSAISVVAEWRIALSGIRPTRNSGDLRLCRTIAATAFRAVPIS